MLFFTSWSVDTFPLLIDILIDAPLLTYTLKIVHTAASHPPKRAIPFSNAPRPGSGCLSPSHPGPSDGENGNRGSFCICLVTGEAERLFTCLSVPCDSSSAISPSRVIARFPVRRFTQLCAGNAQLCPEMRGACANSFTSRNLGHCGHPSLGQGRCMSVTMTTSGACLFFPSRENEKDPDGVPSFLRGPVWCRPLQQHAPRDRGHRGAAGPAALAQGEGRPAGAGLSHPLPMRSRVRDVLLRASVSHCCRDGV